MDAMLSVCVHLKTIRGSRTIGFVVYLVPLKAEFVAVSGL